MAIYYLYFFYTFIISFFSRLKRNNKKSIAFLFWIGLLLIMGLRSEEVGNDLVRYIDHYKKAPYLDLLETSTEIGYMAFIKTLSTLGVGYQGYIFIVSFIVVTSFSWFFYRYSKNVALSFFLHLSIGLFSFTMTGIRQSIAISILIFGLHYALKQKFIPFIILILTASLFHRSAIIFFPVYFLCRLTFESYKPFFFSVLILALFILFNDYFFSYIGYFTFSNFEARYLESGIFKQMNVLPVLFKITLPISVLLIWLFSKQDILKLPKENLIFFVLSIISAVITVLSLNISIIDRLSYFFYPAIFVLLPNTLNDLKNKQIREFIKVFIVIICLAYFTITVEGGITKIDNYSFYWQ